MLTVRELFFAFFTTFLFGFTEDEGKLIGLAYKARKSVGFTQIFFTMCALLLVLIMVRANVLVFHTKKAVFSVLLGKNGHLLVLLTL